MEPYLEDELGEYLEKASVEPTVLSANTLKNPINVLNLSAATTIKPTMTLADAIKLMKDKRFGALLVEEKGQLVGIITERDILFKVIGEVTDLKKHPVSEFMTKNPESLTEDDMIFFAMNKMMVGGFRHVPIINSNGKPFSVVSMRDLIKFVCNHFQDEVINLPINPIRENQEREGG